MAGDDEDAAATRQLAALARTLGVPIEAFFSAGDGERGRRPVTGQEEELLTLFRRIADADQRARCLAFVRAAAGKQAAE